MLANFGDDLARDAPAKRRSSQTPMADGLEGAALHRASAADSAQRVSAARPEIFEANSA
jgi:hypothetical protein